MKNIIMVAVFALFAGTYTGNAQEGKNKAKKESCCSADKKTAAASCEKDKAHVCLTDASCCATSKKSTPKKSNRS